MKCRSLGPAVSVGPTKNQIIGVETVIIPGVVPKRQEGQLFLWTSIFNTAAPKGDTISTVLEADPDSERACNAPHGYW